MLESEKEEALKPFILLVVDRKEGLKAANDLLQKANANPVITTGHPDFQKICFMASIYQMKQGHYTIVKDLLLN